MRGSLSKRGRRRHLVAHASAERKVPETVDFHGYDKEVPYRKHTVQFGELKLFVNGHFLAEKSAFFDKAFFGDFMEGTTNTVSLPTEKPEDFVEFLDVMYGDKVLTDANCATMIKFADIWNCPTLVKKCGVFLESWKSCGVLLPSSGSERLEMCLNVLEVALLHGQKQSVSKLLAYIGKYSCQELKDHNFLERINDKIVIAAVYELVGRDPENRFSECTCLNSLKSG